MTKQIELANGRGFAIVDDEDYERLKQYDFFITGDGYACRSIEKHRRVLMHREILGLIPGDKKEVDHINGTILDNRRENLRIVTRQENCYNKVKQNPKASSSKYKGVSINPRRGKRWRAQISCNRVYYWIGSFDDEVEAAKAYDQKARELFGEFAKLNFS